MYAQIEKPKENKSRAVGNSVAQKKSNAKQDFGFVDNRPKNINTNQAPSNVVLQGMFWEETPNGEMKFHYGPVVNRWWKPTGKQHKGNGRSSYGVYHRKSATRDKNKENFNGLRKDEQWKEYVDLKHHKYGPNVYDIGSHHSPKKTEYTEPGFTKSIENARLHVTKGLGAKLTIEDYGKINKLASSHLKETGWRNKSHTGLSTGVPLDKLPGVNGLNTLKLEQGEIESANRDGRAEIFVEHFDNKGCVSFVPRKSEEVKLIVKDILDEYYNKISKSDKNDKLKIIAETHQLLERLHAFRDANTRTNLLVLNKLLTEQGYHPVILDDPNSSYLVSTDDWVIEIMEGLKKWEHLKGGK